MPIFKNKTEDSDGWLSILLALRLRQIENEYPDYASFADATGLSRGTLYQLRTGKGNIRHPGAAGTAPEGAGVDAHRAYW